jgi:hypothetical protein
MPVYNGTERYYLHSVFKFIPQPLAPLQPVLTGKPENFLAGEGRLIKRGLKAPSLNSLPISNMLKNG